jgi:hypothetical protein
MSRIARAKPVPMPTFSRLHRPPLNCARARGVRCEALNILSQSIKGLPHDYHPPRLQILFRENIPEI